VGLSGVWGVNSGGGVYYRTGTYGDLDVAGSDWESVPGNLRWVASGTNLVVGVNSGGSIYYREGITALIPTGTDWVQVTGNLKQIDIYQNEVVGSNSDGHIYRSPVGQNDGVQTFIKATWEQMSLSLTRISKGNSGVWGVDQDDVVYKLNSDEKSWTRFTMKLIHVASGASVLGVTRADDIWRYLGNGKWERIEGALTNIDVSDNNRVWGVNREQNIYRLTGSKWEPISGKMVQVSVGKSGVWGVNAGGAIYYRTGTYGDLDVSGSDWKKIDGGKKWVASGSDLLVGVNSAGSIYYREGMSSHNPIGKRWVSVPGKLMQIDVHGDDVIGTDFENHSYQTSVTTLGKGSWVQISRRLTRISKGKSGIWGVDDDEYVYKLDSNGESWTRIGGSLLVHVSSGASVWGVDKSDGIYNYIGNNKWKHVEGELTNIDVSDNNRVWGCDRKRHIYRLIGSYWQQIQGSKVQISVGLSGVWGVNSAGGVYYRTGTYGDIDISGSDWEKIDGGFKWVASGTDLLVGVNSAGSIYYREGMSSLTPTGTDWVVVPGKLKQIDLHKDEVVGTDFDGHIYRSPVGHVSDSVQTVINAAAWEHIRHAPLSRISIGKSGTWVVDINGIVYGPSQRVRTLKLVHVSSGASVWGVDSNGKVYKRFGDQDWKRIKGELTNIDVSDNNHVWGCDRHGDIYRLRYYSWQQISGKMVQISVGPSGVWSVNSGGSVYYRKGTYGDKDVAGSDWQRIDGNKRWVASGTNLVVGVNSGGSIYYREGISALTPTGTDWVLVPGKLNQIDVHKDVVLGTKTYSRDSRSSVRGGYFRAPVGPAKCL